MAYFMYKCLKVTVVRSCQIHMSHGSLKRWILFGFPLDENGIAIGTAHRRDPFYQTVYLIIMNPYKLFKVCLSLKK